ncbi:hypothetical protein RRG08_019037 [Elysia crispata]|uniref:Uncharacterized protein n=1 Tax=Elysia crispata TaxID=231223 RepID=A0AAE1DSH3_9GAST|nr:hypothetical protein RRG08_019037 [Elysia crispata]
MDNTYTGELEPAPDQVGRQIVYYLARPREFQEINEPLQDPSTLYITLPATEAGLRWDTARADCQFDDERSARIATPEICWVDNESTSAVTGASKHGTRSDDRQLVRVAHTNCLNRCLQIRKFNPERKRAKKGHELRNETETVLSPLRN